MDAIKKAVIGYIEKYLVVEKYKFKPLNTEDTLLYLKNNTHYVTPYYQGVISYLVLFKSNDKYYSYLVERFSIKQDTIKHSINLLDAKIMAAANVYDGTIIEGTLISNKDSNKFTFMITDLFYLYGKDFTKTPFLEKTKELKSFVNDSVKKSKESNVIFKISKFYEYCKLGQLVKEIIPTIKYKIQGLLFYQKKPGLRITYQQTTFIKAHNNSECELTSGKKFNGNATPLAETKKKSFEIEGAEKLDRTKIEAAFVIKSTKKVDIYKLYLLKKSKLIYHEIANIPTIECSKFCQKLCTLRKKKNNGMIIVSCQLVKGGWKPIEHLIDRKLPDEYYSVLNKINNQDLT